MKRYAYDAILKKLAEGFTISRACQQAGVSRMFYNRHYKSNPEFRARANEALQLGKQLTDDRVMSAFFKKIQEGSPQLIKYYLEHNVAPYKKNREVRREPEVRSDAEAYEVLMRDLYTAARSGDAQSARLWLTQITRKQAGSGYATPGPTSEDLRVIIDALPEPARSEYYQLLNALLLEADKATRGHTGVRASPDQESAWGEVGV